MKEIERPDIDGAPARSMRVGAEEAIRTEKSIGLNFTVHSARIIVTAMPSAL
jgi:hypothetical protein